MANEFESFIKLELPLRPILQNDGAEESVLVRRGTGPRLIELVPLAEGEVLGKSGGEIKGVVVSGGGVEPRYTGTILQGETKEIVRLPVANYKSVLFIVNLDTQDGKSESYQVFCKPLANDVDFMEYANLGDDVNSVAEAILDTVNNELVFRITNNGIVDMDYDISKKS